MITPLAPALTAFWTFTPKLQVPRWMRAMSPLVKPLKSPAVQPLLDELAVGPGGIWMPPAGCTGAVETPAACPASKSTPSVKGRAVGDNSLIAGNPLDAEQE